MTDLLFKNIKLIDCNEIEIIDDISEGGQGEVYKAKYFNKFVVIKRFKQKLKSFELKELVAYVKLKHPLMVEFYGYFIDDDEKLNLVLEYADGYILNDLISSEALNYTQKIQIIQDLANILLYFKENHTLHRDLKPDNIIVNIIDKDTVKLKILDFGICKITDKSIVTLSNNAMSIQYCPPESLQTNVKGNYKYDIWSFGLIIAYLFSEKLPWGKASNIQIEYKLVKKEPYPIPTNIDNINIIKLIKLCTKIVPDDRIAPEGLVYLISILKRKKNITSEDIDHALIR